MTAGEVVRALREQNVQVAAGQVGQPPAAKGIDFQYTMTTLGRLIEPEQFADIIIKTGDDGQIVRLGDVARVELGARTRTSTTTSTASRRPAWAFSSCPARTPWRRPSASRPRWRSLGKRFPAGVDYRIYYDTTPYISESISEVFHTLRDAVLLVAVVVLVFLQNWRSALIPLIAVPVAIIGTFAAMALMGFSLNTLSLFGLVLAIGIVVDDAIVVVEATEHHIEQGMTPRAAPIRPCPRSRRRSSPSGWCWRRVFIPCVFITGITGRFFRQFALTIAVSTILSAFNSLTLSPALCAILLKQRHEHRDPLSWILNLLLGWFFKLFNKGFALSVGGYMWAVGKLLRVSLLVLVVYGGLLYLTGWSFGRMPKGFIPDQDQGYLFVTVQLPDSASLERTDEAMAHADAIIRKTEGVAHTIRISGMSFVLGANGSHLGTMFVVLKPFEERRTPDWRANAIVATLQRRLFQEVRRPQIGVFGPPPVRGLATAGGFKVMIEDRGSEGPAALQEQTDNLVQLGNEQQDRGLRNLLTVFRANTPQLYVDIDRTKCKMLGVALSDVFATLQVELGGLYVNDFNQFGRTWQVNAQADIPYRMQPEGPAPPVCPQRPGRHGPAGHRGDHPRHAAGPSWSTATTCGPPPPSTAARGPA